MVPHNITSLSHADWGIFLCASPNFLLDSDNNLDVCNRKNSTLHVGSDL